MLRLSFFFYWNPYPACPQQQLCWSLSRYISNSHSTRGSHRCRGLFGMDATKKIIFFSFLSFFGFSSFRDILVGFDPTASSVGDFVAVTQLFVPLLFGITWNVSQFLWGNCFIQSFLFPSRVEQFLILPITPRDLPLLSNSRCLSNQRVFCGFFFVRT